MKMNNEVSKLKPFDLEKALKGEKVVTRNGREATEVHHFTWVTGSFSLVAVIEGDLQTFTLQGHIWHGSQTKNDLFMAPKERVVWINFYEDVGRNSAWHDSEESANK